AVLPVNESLRTSVLAHRVAPIAAAGPVMTLHTAGGRPVSSASAAKAKAENGVWLAGRITPVQPAAQPAPALRAIIAVGKFQGVIAANTPIGSRSTIRRRPGRGAGMVSP